MAETTLYDFTHKTIDGEERSLGDYRGKGVEVNGDGRAPLYAWLSSEGTKPEGAGDIQWNFTKFLVGKDGRILARFAPPAEPTSNEIRNAVAEALAE